jgi:hypothetical protein
MIVEKLKVRDPVKAATIGDLEAEHQGGNKASAPGRGSSAS